jgi:hypothetical protein
MRGIFLVFNFKGEIFMRRYFHGFQSACVLFLSIIISVCLASAQTITGRISGTITDASGKSLPGVKVTVINQETQLTRDVTTDDDGFYVVTNLPVGNYTIKAEHKGFKTFSKTNYILVSDGRLTVDFPMEVGEVTENVEITTSLGETVNTTSGELARVVDSQQVQDLALNGRNYQQLVSLIPGTALLSTDALSLATSLNINEQSVNGNRRNSNLLTVDGAFNMDSGSNASQINNVGIDFIQEVKIQTSNFSAEYGRNSGASINVVTRSGTNEFHGSAFEYLRNDRLDARSFFAPRRNKLRYNDFGWSFGGPIIKDKFFFFGGMEWKRIRQEVTQTRTIPTRAQRNGLFSTTLRVPTGYTAIDPSTGATIAAGGNIPGNNLANLRHPSGVVISPNGRAIANVYSAMERLGSSYNEQNGGVVYQLANPFNFRQEIVRLDYRFNDKQSIYGRYIHDMYNLVDPFGTFIGSNLPTTPTNRLRPGTSYQIGHNWILTPQVINDIRVYAAWNGQRVPAVGDTWQRATYGFTFAEAFTGGLYPNGIPNVDVSGLANFRGPAASLIAPTTDIGVSDDITVLKGSHTIKTGMLAIRNRKDQNGRPPYTGFFTFTGRSGVTTGNAFADVLLGNYNTYDEASADPLGFFRFTQFEAYISDSWKMHRKFSVEIGARYQYFVPTYTQTNNVVNFDPALYNPANAVRVLPNGTLDTTVGGNRYNGLVRAKGGVPGDEFNRVPNINTSIYDAIPALAPGGLFHATHKVAPRFSFAWTPFDDNKTAVRGGFGIFYDRPEGNVIFSSLNLPPFLNSVQFENGRVDNPTGGTPRTNTLLGNIDAVDPNLEIPYTMNWSLSLQRELPWGFFGEVAYVSNQGRHLIHQVDINQPTWQDLATLPSANAVNSIRPYKGFSEIRMRVSDSNSNYHALQLYAAKRKGDLHVTTSYTFSKTLTDSNTTGFAEDLRDYYNRHLSYGPAAFDRRHIFVNTFIYSLPFFRNSGGISQATLGNWEVSGITRMQTGPLHTVTYNSRIGRRRADYIGGSVNLPSSERTIARYFNTAAFRAAPEGRPGTAGVGTVEGPGYHVWDFSLRKQFVVKEGVSVQFQVDFFNAFNRANFLLISGTAAQNLDFADSRFGRITDAAPGRNIQLGLRLTF